MAVILYDMNENFILACPLTLISSYSSACQKLLYNNEEINQSYLEKTYDIRTPFFMDGEAKKIAAFIYQSSPADVVNGSALDNFFKLKEKVPFRDASLSDNQTCLHNVIIRKLAKLKHCLKFKKYFSFHPSGTDHENNNYLVREIAEKSLDMTKDNPANLIGCNNSNEYVIHDVGSQKYLIPPRSRYICSKICDFTSYFKEEAFDFIVIDPPWRNKHVRRRKKARGINYSYNMLSVSDLMKIPVKDILSADAIVLIWSTNSRDINEEFENSLVLWDLELVTTWFWMKLTRSGEPVVHASITESRSKLPYEKILIARKLRSNKSVKNIPENLVIASIPSSIHSHKPPLNDILSHTLGLTRQDKCLEIFARNLLPGWTSFGLEALRFQNSAVLKSFNGSYKNHS